jgi:Ca-activated chloride channel homolog
MVFRDWLSTRRVRPGHAAGVVVLCLGGLFLLRAQAAPGTGPEVTTAPLPPLPPMPAATPQGPGGPSTVSFAGPRVHGTFALSGSRELAGAGQPLYADVTLIADAGEEAHAPLSMVIVLDTSGSMEGEKLHEAQVAVKGLIRNMRDDDEVAFVRYSSSAEVIEPLSRVGDVRGSLSAQVDALRAGGGTNIPGGLEAGLRALGEGRGGERVRRVVLVSDGLDSSRIVSEQIARQSAGKGVTVSSMGIGLDFDEAYMAEVARSGHGNFGFVNDQPTLTAFLDRELKETTLTTAVGTVVHMHLPDGVRFVRASGAAAETHGRDVDLSVGALYATDPKKVLVEMASDLPEGATRDFTGSLTWTTVGGQPADATIPQLQIVATADPAAVSAAKNDEVLARAASVKASEREIEAAHAYAAGDTTRAAGLIQQNVQDLGRAARSAPAPLAMHLSAQSSEYTKQLGAFGSAKPSSAAGRFAAKSAAAKSSENFSRNAF